MSKTVKRDVSGEITHILVDNEMMKVEDANKVLYGSVDAVQVELCLEKIYGDVRLIDAHDFIADIINKEESILDLKKKMMGFKKF